MDDRVEKIANKSFASMEGMDVDERVEEFDFLSSIRPCDGLAKTALSAPLNVEVTIGFGCMYLFTQIVLSLTTTGLFIAPEAVRISQWIPVFFK